MKSYKGEGEALLLLILVVLGLCGVGGCMAWMPQYGVYSAEMSGKATLAEAEYSKQAKVQEARAKKDSAQFEADSEVIRARGVAEANRIIGNSLKGNDSYLRYLWIQNLNSGVGERVYIPTEAGLPLLEARNK